MKILPKTKKMTRLLKFYQILSHWWERVFREPAWGELD